jgi:UDP-GlcNAc:undecaprenyl-phosphate GlcNAc-1-phosphate transferase
MVLTYVFAGLLAFLLALYGTPIARSAALRFGVVDRPDGKLKDQADAVPYFGGLAIYLSVLIPLCLFYDFDSRILSILLSGTLVLLLGLIDDFGVLRPTAKFAGQLIAAIVLIKGDVCIKIASFPPQLNLILTILWIIGMCNAMNIIDIMDGLSAGTALIAAVFLFGVAVLNGHTLIAVFTVTLAGGLVGFLRYNFSPAKIYMGDTGSMFLGLTLGALAMIGDYTANNRLAFFNPLLFLAIPLFDTAYVMILRLIHGRSPFLGSKDHFAVRLKKKGWSATKIVLTSYAISAVLGGGAIVNMFMDGQQSLILYSAVLLFFLVAGWRLSRINVAS